MTAPTILSDVASATFQDKMEPQGVIAQQFVVSVPAATANNTVIGLIRFQPNFTLKDFAINNAALGAGATASIGYVYDGTTGENQSYYGTGQTLAAAGSVVYPVAGGSNVGIPFTATDFGYLCLVTTGTVPASTGTLQGLVSFTYNK